MKGSMKAIRSFLAGFGVPVWIEGSMPQDAQLPYITFSQVETTWDASTTMNVRVWDRSTSVATVAGIVDKISDAIGEGVVLPTENGYVYLYKGNPWAQLQPMEGTDMKVVYLNFAINTMN